MAEKAPPHALLALLQEKLGLAGEEQRARAAGLFEDCVRLLKQSTETETILQVGAVGNVRPRAAR